MIDNSRDFTQAVKGALEKTGRYLVAEENDSSKAHQIPKSSTRPLPLGSVLAIVFLGGATIAVVLVVGTLITSR